jgi:hypothetical protein
LHRIGLHTNRSDTLANLDYVEVPYGQYLEDPRSADEGWALAVADHGFALEGGLAPG